MQPVTPMLTLSTTAPAPGVLAFESFGYGGYSAAPTLMLSRPTGGKGTARYAFGSPLNTFWVAGNRDDSFQLLQSAAAAL